MVSLYDLFDADGDYMGRVQGPASLMSLPSPVAHGTTVWGVERDNYGVHFLTRYRLTRGHSDTAP